MTISLRTSNSTADAVTTGTSKARKGFVLVEVIVAMVLLAVAVTSLAAMMYSVSQNGMKATGNAYRNGVLMQEVNRLEGLPYDSVAVGSSSVTVSGGSYPHTRTITVAQPVANVVKTVQVIIKPLQANYKPDTVSFTRTKARSSRVLCTTCQ
jgi:prepilin-type N-terminal cleavage/methylation domain-containing protein